MNANSHQLGQLPEPSRVSVAVDAPLHSGLVGSLDYLSECALSPGALVRVPLGRREVPGVVWTTPPQDDPDQAVRPVTEVLDAVPPLTERWCQLVAFTASYYQRSLGEVAMSVLPPELKKLDNTQLANRVAKLRKTHALPLPPSDAPQRPELTAEQAEVLERLEALNVPGQAPVVLLHGLTGSGKTEVYLRAAEQALAQGRQVLVLVPEINLTPQLEARFAERFSVGENPRRIVSMHSGLTPAQRLKSWLSAHLGLADLVLGTRMAVFAPLPRLGLIVVDEEHDPSFKQQEGARYSARDLAVYRGKLDGACVVLGSATPSLESWQRADQGRYQRLSLPTRVGGGALPTVRLADMNLLPKVRGATTALTPQLIAAMQRRLERGEQSLVFLNRRGYAPVLHCTDCGWKSGCPHCSAWRVFHKVDRSLRCHHCGFAQPVPRACPDCGNLDIAPLGQGTERLEEQLAEALPGARMARIDADTTRLKGSLESQLSAVHAGEVDVLVGTQMITKGHDFRRITLVAAINPDSALFSSDFRAPERLFSLLMQAAGRAGRDASQAARSEMWVQTWHPTHPVYTSLLKHDFESFARSQLQERETAGLPPYASLALIRAEARTVEAARAFLEAAADAANDIAGAQELLIYPPVPTTIARIAGVERMQMLVEAASRGALQRVLTPWVDRLPGLRQQHKALLRWAVDVDPLAI